MNTSDFRYGNPVDDLKLILFPRLRVNNAPKTVFLFKVQPQESKGTPENSQGIQKKAVRPW